MEKNSVSERKTGAAIENTRFSKLHPKGMEQRS